MSSTGHFERLSIGSAAADVRVRVDGRARRISIKVDRIGGVVTLTSPSQAMLPEARRFLQTRTDWVQARQTEAVAPTPFAPGETIPIFGAPRMIVHQPYWKDPVSLKSDKILVSGAARLTGFLITNFLKAEARRRLIQATNAHAARIGVTVSAISIRDQKTRWGSCSAKGRLAFSWRLAMAPPSVLNYLAAHEVAHLRHMNHGPKFWRLVAELDPDWRKAEAWLKADGATLRRYG